MAERFIALLSDFGWQDPWIGQMKSIIYQENPNAKVVDLCHELPSFDIFSAGFKLFRAFKDFPVYSIFVCVVDPGVGGKRRPILVVTEDHYFVGPDNGIFSFIYKTENVRQVLHINATHYFRQPVSNTFQARDIFSPIAARLSEGIEVDKLGEPVEDYLKIPIPDEKIEDGKIKGAICGLDKFGNLITNIRFSSIKELASLTKMSNFSVFVQNKEIKLVGGGYEQKLPVFAILNSSNLIEIACSASSAAEFLKIGKLPVPVEIVGAK